MASSAIHSRIKRRSRRTLAARLKTYWMPAILVLIVLAVGAYRALTAPVFELKSLSVSGLVRLTPREVLARAEIRPRSNVWLLDTGAIERRIDAIPYVESAWLHRRFPATVWIVVAERTPAACVSGTNYRAFTVDARLRVLERGCLLETGPLYELSTPLDAEPGEFLHDAELLRLQDDDQLLATAGKHYRTLRESRFGRLVATLSDGITVQFGADDDLLREQSLIAPILTALGPRRAAQVSTVDLRAPTTPVVRYRAAAPVKFLRAR